MPGRRQLSQWVKVAAATALGMSRPADYLWQTPELTAVVILCRSSTSGAARPGEPGAMNIRRSAGCDRLSMVEAWRIPAGSKISNGRDYAAELSISPVRQGDVQDPV
jgi:hypothetical protein